MDLELKRILDERLARGEIDFEEHRRLVARLGEPSSKFCAVLLNAVGPNKIAVIRVVRETTGAGLKEAKLLVEAAPAVVAQGLDRDAADAVVRSLQDVGAAADLAPDDSHALIAARQAAAIAREQAASGCLVMVAAFLAAAIMFSV